MKRIYSLAVLICLSFGLIWSQGKVAYLSIYESVNSIEDDDEKAAATWFTGTYKGDFLPLSQATEAKLAEYDAIWIHVDDEYFPEAPDEFYDTDMLGLITNYYKNGGNLLLTVHAVGYLNDLGRIDLAVDVKGAGSASENEDIWYVSPTWGTFLKNGTTPQTVVDRSTDKIYAGLTSEAIIRDDSKEYVQFPLISPGLKEDHNCFWTMDIPSNLIANDDYSKITTFESTYNMEALGTWAHVQDYFGAAIARWKPTGEYKGTAITIGVAAYEWNQNSGANAYQSNIEKMTANALNELGGGTTGINKASADNNIAVIGNVLMASANNLSSAKIFTATGLQVAAYNAEELAVGADISTLQQGIYIVALYDNAGNTIAAKKFGR